MGQFKNFSLFLILLVFQLGLGQDTTAPTLSSLTHDHDDLVVNGNETVIITATFSENMISSPTISIGGDDNDIDQESMTATSSSVWTFTWNVPDNKNGVYFATVSGTDLSGNYYAGTDSITFTVDNTDPTLALVENDADDVLINGETVLLTASANETISGTPTLTITTSGGSNDFAMTSSGVSWTYSYSPPSSYSGVVTFTVEMIDVAGNTGSTTISLNADTIIPTINQITSPMANGTYTDYDGNNPLSDTISVTVSFTESVTVDTTNGSPRLLLNTTPASFIYYIDGSGTATLTFNNLVNDEVKADDLNISAFELNGGTIVDLASNTASLTLDYVTSNATNLSDLKDIVIDAKNPTISNHSLSDNNNLAPIPTTSVNDGDIATFGFQSDKELLMSSLTVTFTGFTTTVTKTVSGSGPYNYELSFTVSSTFPEGDVEIDISATDQVTTTVVPIGNPTGIFTEEFFPDRIRIDRTAPIITSNANLNSDENTSTGPTITASEGVIFSIDGGADQALISINQGTGVLTFSSAPDYEAPIDTGADNTYEIIVKAIDAVGLTVTQTVNIQINDLNDTFGVEVTQTDIQTTESGETASIGFVLITQPSANVIIGLSLSDTTEGSLGAAQLTFTPDNWNTVQTITINGVDDGLTDGDVTYQLITANTTSNDTSYNGLVVDDVTL
ncbi:cadherin repeat domain-containing protein, partial [Flavobacteriaceae bacterium]|nr:cadherin repeat domain-containing protein [Flavobacteriaceae bacterium]